MSSLKGKVVVITGAGRGLGKTMADIFTSRSSIVVTTDIKGANIPVDVTSERELNTVVKEIISNFKKIDIWINNAGVWLPKTAVEDIEMEKIRTLFEVNVLGTIQGTRAVLPSMKEKGGGTIVNISSTTAFDGMSGSSGSAYVSSKYAIRGFTNALRKELEGTGISVIGVYPGGIKTQLFDGNEPEAIDEFMEPEAVAEKIVDNLEKEFPGVELVIKRPGQKNTNEKP